MGDIMGLSAIAAVESLLRVFTYIAVITAIYKFIQALNIYIDRNSR